MKRALFLLQFRRTLVPFGLVFLSADAGMAIIEWAVIKTNKSAGNVGEVIGTLLAAIGLALAIPLGATAFSRDFKEKHHLFIHSLPLSRETMWAVLTGANFSAMVGCLGLMVAFRPSMITAAAASPLVDDLVVVILALLVLCVCFLAGSCFALCFRRDLLGYLVAIFVTGAVLGGISALAAVCGSEPRAGWRVPHSGAMLVSLGSVVLLLVWLSRWFFVAGEITLLRVQFRNTALTLSCLVAVLVGLSTAISLGLFSRFDPWSFESWWGADVSPDGKYLLVVERREDHRQFARLNLFDVRSGKLLRQTRYTGLREAGLPTSDVVLTLADELPLGRLFYLLPRSDTLVQVPASGGPAREIPFPSASIWWGLGRRQHVHKGKLLIAMQRKDATKLVSFDTATGEVRDTCAGDSGSWVWYWDEGEETVVCFLGSRARGDQAAAPASVWRLGETEKKIPWSGRATPDRPKCVVHDVALATESACVQRVKELYPGPAAGAGVGGYLLPGIGNFSHSYLGEKTPVFYLRIPGKESVGTLLVWDRPKSAWTTVAENLPLFRGVREALGQGYLAGAYNPTVLPAAGLSVFYQKAPSGFAVYAYDAKRDSSQKLGIVSDPNGNPPKVFVLQRRDVFLITIHRGGTNTPLMKFRYAPQSGRLTPLSLSHTLEVYEEVLFADDAGNQVVIRRSDIYRRNTDAFEVRLWPPK